MIIKVLIGFLLTTLISFSVLSQNDTTGMSQQFENAVDLMNNKDYVKANRLFKDVASNYKSQDAGKYYTCLNKIGHCYLFLRQFDSAKYYINYVLDNGIADSL